MSLYKQLIPGWKQFASRNSRCAEPLVQVMVTTRHSRRPSALARERSSEGYDPPEDARSRLTIQAQMVELRRRLRPSSQGEFRGPVRPTVAGHVKRKFQPAPYAQLVECRP